jgi:hypothetical protein
MVQSFVEEPANSFSTLKMEAEGISEMLVHDYNFYGASSPEYRRLILITVGT